MTMNNKIFRNIYKNLTLTNKIYMFFMKEKEFESANILKYKKEMDEKNPNLEVSYVWLDYDNPKIQKDMKDFLNIETLEQSVVGVSYNEGIFLYLEYKEVKKNLKK